MLSPRPIGGLVLQAKRRHVRRSVGVNPMGQAHVRGEVGHGARSWME